MTQFTDHELAMIWQAVIESAKVARSNAEAAPIVLASIRYADVAQQYDAIAEKAVDMQRESM